MILTRRGRPHLRLVMIPGVTSLSAITIRTVTTTGLTIVILTTSPQHCPRLTDRTDDISVARTTQRPAHTPLPMKTTKCENVKFRQYNGKSLENFRPLMCSLHISTIVLVVVGGLECLESFKKYFGIG